MSATEKLDLIGIVARRWKLLALSAVLGGAAGLAYTMVAPKWYEARLTVVPSQHSSNAALSVLANLPAADILGTASSTDVQRIQAVLASTSVADEVIARFHLDERYDTAHLEQTREALAKHCATGVDRKPGIVVLTCEDQDPEKAMAMTAFFGEVGNRVFARISASSAREERKFLETQVVQARKDVDESSRKLREFQELHRVVDLGEQSKAVISAMATIKGELVSKQLQLSYLSNFSSRTEASVVQLQQQISIMEAKLKQLEDSQPPPVLVTPPAGAGSGSGSGVMDPSFFPDAMRVPALRFELEQLFRDQKIHETVFFLMTQRYETAKVDEARDTSTFQILDYPTLPTYRSRPKRRNLVMIGAGAGVALGAAFLILPGRWRRRRDSGAV